MKSSLFGLPLLIACTMMLAQNPVPFVNQPLVPSAIAPGGPTFTLTVNGAGFVSGSTVNWNGAALATTFVSSSQLTATVPAANIANASTASIKVSSPAPGGGNSSGAYFEVSAPTDLKFSSVPLTPTDFNGCNAQLAVSCSNFVVADFNGDGNLDLTYGSFEYEGAYIFGGGLTSLGIGDGTFQSPIASGTAEFSFFVVADINADGKIDQLQINQGSAVGPTPYNIALALGKGDGTFSPPVKFGSGTTLDVFAWSVVTGDFNGDGKLDVAILDDLGVEVYLGNGDGSFQASLGSAGGAGAGGGLLVVGDFNNDGKLDITEIAGGQLQILLGNGNGTFTGGATYGGFPSSSAEIFTADFNGDDKPDLVILQLVSTSGGTMTVLLGNGDGTFANGTVYQVSGALNGGTIADFNADGRLDVALVNSTPDTGTITLMLGNGDGTFQSPTLLSSISFGIVSPTIAAGDFNNDGKMDFAGSSGIGIVALLQDYSPNFLLAVTSPTSVTVAAGQPANYMVNVTPVADFKQAVSLTCSGAPAQSTCTITPSSVTLDGVDPVTVTVAVTTTATAMSLAPKVITPFAVGHIGLFVGLVGLLVLIALAFMSGRRGAVKPQFACIMLVSLFSIGIAMTGCSGSGSKNSGGTPSGTYTLVVTGTSNSALAALTHNTKLTLIVQ